MVSSDGSAVPAPLPLDFHAVYETWFEPVSRWISAMGGPQADREDLVQDVFVVVHRRLPSFDGRNIAGWLYQIARRRVRDFRRLAWVKHVLRRPEPLPELANSDPSPIVTLETRRKGQLLEQALSTLTSGERAAIVLFEIEGLSGEQIATIQGVSLNTVWGRIRHGRQKLRACLASKQAAPSMALSAGQKKLARAS
ncbi:MAG: sigma-70 family RNA polymerase sigma factor [Myxococcales bacterium]|jgi:RNA polymerase sigma-70 factor (ECF subfamily)